MTIHTGLFAQLDTEEKFVSVIAHELAHYYRAHSATFEEYDYYYELLSKNRGSKPKPNKRLLKSGEKVFKAAQFKRNMRPWEEGNSHENDIRAEFFISAGSFITSSCAYKSCDSTCSDIAALWKNGPLYRRKLGSYPYTADVSFEKLNTVSQKIIACMATLPVEPQTVDRLILGIAKPQYNPLVKTPKTAMDLARLLYQEKAVWAKKSYNTVKELLIDFQAHVEFLDKAASTIFSRSLKSSLGQYTTEQEADDISLELLAAIGIDPVNAAELFIEFAPEKDQYSGFIYGKERCKRLFENGWKEFDGSRIMVPIGDYSENHHSGCYRAFNVSRELESGVHDYEISSDDNVGEFSWSELRERARYHNDKIRGFIEEGAKESSFNSIHDAFFDIYSISSSCILNTKKKLALTG